MSAFRQVNSPAQECTLPLVSTVQRLSVEEVEEAALEALFQRGLQLRLYFAPFVFLAAIILLDRKSVV